MSYPGKEELYEKAEEMFEDDIWGQFDSDTDEDFIAFIHTYDQKLFDRLLSDFINTPKGQEFRNEAIQRIALRILRNQPEPDTMEDR